MTAEPLSLACRGGTDCLCAAWREAEAALPPEAIIRGGRTGVTATGWATVYLHGNHIATAFSNEGFADALLELARGWRGRKELG